jgi:predicted ATPase/DNA-binding CsgD family transcriptional regulator/uncharacterized protein HemY
MSIGDTAQLARRCERLGSFVGRGAELDQVRRLLASKRVVTLVGPPGVGKTRLALQLGADLGLTSASEVCVIELADAASAGDVAGVVSAALGVTPGCFLGHALDGRGDLLVILDNCEHMVEGCNAVVGAIVAAGDGPRVLATSQVPLGLRDEAVFRLAPLSLPAADEVRMPEAFVHSEAVQLFCARAEAAGSTFLPNASNAAAVVELCRCLDGLPLAIELAAPLVVALSPEAMVDQLERDSNLSWQAWPDSLPRHHSPEAALKWSCGLLGGGERTLLRSLGVFAASFDAEMAQAVCAPEVGGAQVRSSLATLTQRSLVVVADGSGPHPHPRYRLLDNMRRVLGAELDHSPEGREVRARHARWCLGLVDAAGDPDRDQDWCQRLHVDPAEVTAALQWALEAADAELAFALVRAQVALCRRRGEHASAREWLERVVALEAPAPASLRAKVLLEAGGMAAVGGDLPAAMAHLRQSAAAYHGEGDHQGEACALSTLGFVSLLGEEPAAGLDSLDQGVATARAGCGDASLAEALAASGRARLLVGEVALAEEHFSESLVLARRTGHHTVLAQASAGLGQVSIVQGRYEPAARLLSDALVRSREENEPHATAVALAGLGELARLQGQDSEAQERFEECATLGREAQVPYPLGRALVGLGRLAQARGQLTEANQRFEEALRTANQAHIPFLVGPSFLGLGEVSLMRGETSPARALLVEALAVARSAADKLGQASALFSLGRLARIQGELEKASLLHCEALELRTEVGDQAGIADSLEAMGGLTVGETRAARLFGAAKSLRGAGFIRPTWLQEEYARDVALTYERLSDERFEAAYVDGAGLGSEEAVVYAMSPAPGEHPLEGWEALTRAERRIVDLVARGLSNRDIADELFISARTVQTHLRHVFPKLGVASRSALAKAVLRRRAG